MKNKVQCKKCKAILENDSISTTAHYKEVHNGKIYGVEEVLSTTKTIKASKKRKIQDIIVPEIEINAQAPSLYNIKSEESLNFGNLWNNVTSENGSQYTETPENISWSQLMGSLGVLVSKLQECKNIYDNASKSDYVNQEAGAIDIINSVISVKEVSNQIVDLGNQFLQQPFDINKQVSCYIHDPANRPQNMTDSQRQYLINMGPHRPRLAKFPHDGKNRFSAKWYDEYEHLEYSLEKDAAFCFTCSLFRREKREEAWASVGVKTWSKMKSRGKDKPGKLQTHFLSESHRASLQDYYLSFSAPQKFT